MVKDFRKFVEETLGNTLFIFDIDDTLFKTHARVFVKDSNGKIVDYLNSADYTSHKLLPGQSYEFSEFENSRIFDMTSRPITRIIDKVRNLQKTIPNTSDIIFITARSDFDDKEKFLNVFRKRNIDIDKIHIYRVGNDPGPESNAVKKAKVVRNYLGGKRYDNVLMFDDNKENLEEFKNIQKDYPYISFTAYQVFHDGSTKQF
jgi:predicted ribosome quality control (RQC) complex YloA/Tae2 family protein